MSMRLGFLGTGTITSAMVTGLSATKDEYAMVLSPRNGVIAADLARRFPSVAIASSNQAVLDACETVVIAVRPQIAEGVLKELRFSADHNVVSVVSGVPVARLSGLVAPAAKITRAVPLPSAARRGSPTAIYPRDRLTVELFGLLGEAFAVDTEREFDALCTVTATMATYFAFAGGAAGWLTRQGIAAQEARDYVAAIFLGLAETAVEGRGSSFEELAAQHATRGGTNEQVLTYLRGHGVFERFGEGLDGVMRRVTEAGKE
jgi:pyrroline-5-carboxylate reductase